MKTLYAELILCDAPASGTSAENQLGLVRTDGKVTGIKVGDGVTDWSQLDSLFHSKEEVNALIGTNTGAGAITMSNYDAVIDTLFNATPTDYAVGQTIYVDDNVPSLYISEVATTASDEKPDVTKFLNNMFSSTTTNQTQQVGYYKLRPIVSKPNLLKAYWHTPNPKATNPDNAYLAFPQWTQTGTTGFITYLRGDCIIVQNSTTTEKPKIHYGSSQINFYPDANKTTTWRTNYAHNSIFGKNKSGADFNLLLPLDYTAKTGNTLATEGFVTTITNNLSNRIKVATGTWKRHPNWTTSNTEGILEDKFTVGCSYMITGDALHLLQGDEKTAVTDTSTAIITDSSNYSALILIMPEQTTIWNSMEGYYCKAILIGQGTLFPIYKAKDFFIATNSQYNYVKVSANGGCGIWSF